MPNFAGFLTYLGATCLFAIFEISHQSRSPLRSFFEIPKLLKNTGKNCATYFFTITKLPSARFSSNPNPKILFIEKTARSPLKTDFGQFFCALKFYQTPT